MTREDLRDIVSSVIKEISLGYEPLVAVRKVIEKSNYTDEQLKRIIESTNHSVMNMIYKQKDDKKFAFDVVRFEDVKDEKKKSGTDTDVATKKESSFILESDNEKIFEKRFEVESLTKDFSKVAAAGLRTGTELFSLICDESDFSKIAEHSYEHEKRAERLNDLFLKTKTGGQVLDAIKGSKLNITKIKQNMKKIGFMTDIIGAAAPTAMGAASQGLGVSPFIRGAMATYNAGNQAAKQLDPSKGILENTGNTLNREGKSFMNYFMTGKGGLE